MGCIGGVELFHDAFSRHIGIVRICREKILTTYTFSRHIQYVVKLIVKTCFHDIYSRHIRMYSRHIKFSRCKLTTYSHDEKHSTTYPTTYSITRHRHGATPRWHFRSLFNVVEPIVTSNREYMSWVYVVEILRICRENHLYMSWWTPIVRPIVKITCICRENHLSWEYVVKNHPYVVKITYRDFISWSYVVIICRDYISWWYIVMIYREYHRDDIPWIP